MPKHPTGPEDLYKKLPGDCRHILHPLLDNQKLHYKITRGRITKFGDFNASTVPGCIPIISINGNLNPFSFLITLLHELAHFYVWKEGHYYAKPHGRTWKYHFRNLMNNFISANAFPPELLPHIEKHMRNPKATSCSDPALFKELSKYDTDNHGIYIDEIPDNTHFTTRKGDVFIRLKKVRTRLLCHEVKSGRKFLFSPVYRVFPIKD